MAVLLALVIAALLASALALPAPAVAAKLRPLPVEHGQAIPISDAIRSDMHDPALALARGGRLA